MNRNFILVDHSIEDSTGHYLEYAKRVLRAAKSLGFKTILGVNANAETVICSDADLIDKAFSRTFWENQTIPRTALVGNYFRKHSGITGDPYFSRSCAKELKRFFSRVGAKAGDIVFVPTLGGIELIGIALYSATKSSIAMDWHLLFRRDLPMPDSIFISKARINHFRTSAGFSEFDKRFSKGQVAFYTDTEDLTERYSRAVNMAFTTLPIPIDDALAVKNKNNGTPLIVSYLGDAREEKGIHLLPELITAVRTQGFSETDVQFRVQTNLPLTATSARTVRTKNLLTGLQGKGLQIIEGPFSSEVYHQLISSSDVILIPYCPKSYEARSSGIFTEALAAGVPTVYPLGTWMAKAKTLCGSVEYDEISGIKTALLTILANYPKHEEKSIAFSAQWRQQHSAHNLLSQILKDSEKP
jgi:glycosyltransferase involved in cell wall biosynthesis